MAAETNDTPFMGKTIRPVLRNTLAADGGPSLARCQMIVATGDDGCTVTAAQARFGSKLPDAEQYAPRKRAEARRQVRKRAWFDRDEQLEIFASFERE